MHPLRSDPWRLFFPVGVLLAWAGVLHWLLYATGATERYEAVFHATAQIQGFITCFALGFLFTFVPRRTGTAPPSWPVLATGLAAPVAATAAAWGHHTVLAQVIWAAGMGLMAVFVGQRVLGSGAPRKLPGIFVWVPVALVAGAGGAGLVAVAAAIGPQDAPQLWRLGRGLLLQGFVTALAVGVGGTMLPTLTRGEPSPAADLGGWNARGPQALAALAFLASFPLEAHVSAPAGFLVRALVAGGVLVPAARLWRRPSVPGLHRRLIWLSAWLLPLGYLAAAADPDLRVAALHLVFIGGFALMTLAVSLHVALAHGGRPERLAGSRWPVWTLGLALGAATSARLLVGLDAAHPNPWLALAASSFLLATLAWAAAVGPTLRGTRTG